MLEKTKTQGGKRGTRKDEEKTKHPSPLELLCDGYGWDTIGFSNDVSICLCHQRNPKEQMWKWQMEK